MTLAYVFWHWTAQPAESYGARLVAFHAALEADRPSGFLRSHSFAIEGAPWVPLSRGFEDWYLVEDFAALGALNDAAVSGRRRSPHDAVAALAAGGAGGVYRLKSGDPAGALAAHWFGKSAGMTYDDLFELLRPLESRAALWQRQMVLGPAPEFCLASSAPISLPRELVATRVSCRAL
ncbi:MAG TPA: hypothetical protein VG496_15230 [Myxococcales bacterium]|nr:hypothetical protein [Myxococcales bacterium]